MNKEKTRIFIFSYNEEISVLRTIISSLKELHPEFKIILIDDGSVEGKYTDLIPEIDIYLRHNTNLGIGFSRNTAFKIACKKDLDQCIFLDGDGQHDPESISTLLLSDSDITIGSRFLAGNDLESTSELRIVGIEVIRKIIWSLFNIRITDPTSGLRKYSRKAIKILAEQEPYEYPEALEISDAWSNGLSINEVQVKMRPRVSGKSTIGFLKSIYYMFDISVTLLLNYFHSKK